MFLPLCKYLIHSVKRKERSWISYAIWRGTVINFITPLGGQLSSWHFLPVTEYMYWPPIKNVTFTPCLWAMSRVNPTSELRFRRSLKPACSITEASKIRLFVRLEFYGTVSKEVMSSRWVNPTGKNVLQLPSTVLFPLLKSIYVLSRTMFSIHFQTFWMQESVFKWDKRI